MNACHRAAKRSVAWAVLASATSLATPTAAAGPQTIYRCGQTYQQWPCKDGKPLAVDDSRDSAQQQAAHAAAAAERRTAEGLRAERRERDKALLPANHDKSDRAAAPAGIAPAVPKVTAPDADKRKPRAPVPEPQRYYPRNAKPAPVDGRIAKP